MDFKNSSTLLEPRWRVNELKNFGDANGTPIEKYSCKRGQLFEIDARKGKFNMASHNELISIGTFSLVRSELADRVNKVARADRTDSIKRNYPDKGSGAGSTAIFDRARSMFVRSIFNERSVR